jgi:hypothetical protein
MTPRERTATRHWTIVGVIVAGAAISAHSGPPFPIVSNQISGAYLVSLWTDPDTTDDGSAAGKFWVMIDPARKDVPLAPDTRVNVSIRPMDRQGSVRTGIAEPVEHEASRRFIALVMDHEGPYTVRVTIEGSLGRADVEAAVDATYDVRPGPMMLVLALMPFLLVGFLWLKVLLRRRLGKKRSRQPSNRFEGVFPRE